MVARHIDIEWLVVWVVPLLTWLCAVMQLNTHAVWSDSRMLRELRFLKRLKGAALQREAANEGAMGEPGESDEVIALLYAQMSKGQHCLSGRMYQEALPLLFIFIDVTLSIDPLFLNEIMQSEALITLRLLVCAGSTVVLGARPLSVVESVVMFVCFSAYLSAMLLDFRLFRYFGINIVSAVRLSLFWPFSRPSPFSTSTRRRAARSARSLT